MINQEEFLNTQSLALRHANLMQEIEELPPGTKISPIKRSKIKELEKELKKRLIRHLIGDPFPVTKKED